MMVYDTTHLIENKLSSLRDDFVVPSLVLEEIKGGKLKDYIDSIRDQIRVVNPDQKSLETVIRAAKETGDFDRMSLTDIHVVAVALMIGDATVVSDDYAVQNVCSHLHVKFSGVKIRTIRKEIVWKWRCTGCRKMFDEYVSRCPVCGHPTSRISVHTKDALSGDSQR